MKEQTRLIRSQAEKSTYREHAVPLYLTSSFTFEDAQQGAAIFAEEMEANVYSRFSNPNTSEFVQKVCEMEGAEDGVAFASGMAAVYASFASFLNAGDHIIACRSVFGSSIQLLTQLLPRWGVKTTFVDTLNPGQWESEIRPETKMIFLETPSNPGLELVDLEWLGSLKDRYPNIILNVDNCFATPYLQKPIDYGIDIVSHSATKYMDGQGRVLGGVVVGSKSLIKEVKFFARHTGAAMSAFNAWILSKSLETLPLRMDRHCSNAFAVATVIETHRNVESVRYPFLSSHPQHELARRQMKLGGGVITLIVKDGLVGAHKFLNSLKMITLTANLGDSRSIATHPASTTHCRLTAEQQRQIGIFPGSIRISVGLEDVYDIIDDIDHALDHVSKFYGDQS